MPPVHPDIHVNPSPSYVLGVGQGTEYQDMALGYERQGDFARAEAMYLQAIQIKETHLGLNHPSLAITLNSLGELYYRNLNRPDDAERVLSRALQIRREIEPAFDAAVTRENLGAVYEMKGNLEAAREMRQRGRPHQVACGNYDVRVWLSALPSSQLTSPSALVRCTVIQRENSPSVASVRSVALPWVKFNLTDTQIL